MNPNVDYAAFEFGLARLRLRDDLKFTLHGTSFWPARSHVREQFDDRWYIIEDEANGKFYRIGHAEYVFLSLLDGRTTIQSAIAETAAELGTEAFTENEAATLCKWLIDTDLADKPRHDREQWSESQKRRRMARRANWTNPIMLKLPLGNPDLFASRLTRACGWLVSWPIGVAMIILWSAAISILIPQVHVLLRPSATIFAATNWMWLGICWLLLRVIHELAHAVTCKRYGGSVREWGILWLMFIPLPYVDVTSAWRFPTRGARVLTSAAGMIAELSVAAVAVIIWTNTDVGLVRQNAVNIMLAASVTTLLFNANPLMRFDGYHILADLLNAPNLWTHGRQFVKGIGRRLFFDLPTPKPAWRSHQTWFVQLYGFASIVWTVLIFLSLSLGALSLFDGIGLILASIAITLWLGWPLFRLTSFLVHGTEFETPDRKRFAVATVGTVTGLFMIGIIVPAPTVLNAPITIQHEPLTIVRAKSAGFVTDYLVQPGQHVNKGDILCKLENIELAAEFREVSLQLTASQQRVRAFRSAGEPAAAQQEIEATEDLKRRHDELTELVAQLQVHSPADGIILDDCLSDRVGSYVKRGHEIIALGGDGPKTAIGLVSQRDAYLLSGLQNAAVDVRIWGTYGTAYHGRIQRVNPRAQTALPHFAFAAPHGGPLAVIADDPVNNTNRTDDSATPATQWQLVNPRVNIEIELDRDASENMRTGQTGVVHIRARNSRLGSYLLTGVFRYLRDRIQRTHGV